jgi:hypothetical protein
MSPESWTATIAGPDDVEMPIPRSSKITYHVTAPKTGAKGLVFVIHGFGGDTDGGYDTHLRQHLAEAYGLAAVTVEYHCYHSRPPLGASVNIPPEELQRLQAFAWQVGLGGTVSGSNVGEVLKSVGERLSDTVVVKAQLVPPNGDYQNFGVLQAMDHLYVLDDLLREGRDFDRGQIWAFGSSHGGYLAHLLHKIAPCTLSAVIDNSGYTYAGRRYLGLGAEYNLTVGRVVLACSVVTRWDFIDPESPCYYGVPQELIRNVAYAPHISECARASESRCRFRMTNSKSDRISPSSLKVRQDAAYRAAGFDSQLVLFGEGSPSPDFVKSSEHADISLKQFFHQFAPALLERPARGPLDRDCRTTLTFDCAESRYRVQHAPETPSIRLQIDRS